MSRPRFELADVFRRYGQAFRASCSPSKFQRRVMRAVEQCRTAALGGQIEQCDQCGRRRICYRSCRNRHCPKCQGSARAEWLAKRSSELLDCEYYSALGNIPSWFLNSGGARTLGDIGLGIFTDCSRTRTPRHRDGIGLVPAAKE